MDLPTNVTFRLVQPTFGLGTICSDVDVDEMSSQKDKTSFRKIGGGVVIIVSVEISS